MGAVATDEPKTKSEVKFIRLGEHSKPATHPTTIKNTGVNK